MLGKLMTYELRALWKPAIIMVAIMVAAGMVGAGCLGATQALSEVARSGNGILAAPMAGNATAVLFMAALWVAYLLLVALALGALLMYTLMVLAVSGGDVDAVAGMLSIMGGWGAFVADGDVASALGGIVNTLVTCAYALGLAFCSLTLGAWWARRHKVAAAVGVYLAVGWAIALVFSIAGVLAMAGDVVSWNVALTVVSLVQTLANIGVAAGGLALSAHLLRTKIDLS